MAQATARISKADATATVVPLPAGRPLLRFIACGSVDDGKSTLLGRLLHDTHAVSDDLNDVLADDSKRFGTTGAAPDFALLLDGLEAEREQGITIDVAYRYFATPRRKFIVADTPGHEQYTRNMVTGASTADLAIILVDAAQGIARQTRRHSGIVHALGVRNIVLAINKMDLVGFGQARFDTLVAEYAELAARIGIAGFTAIPIAARSGDNVVERGTRMPWFGGPTLIEALEAASPAAGRESEPFAMAVQRVARPDATFRGYAGRIAMGRLRPGDAVRVLPSGAPATIARIVAPGADRRQASSGESVMLTFAEPVDCARGDILVAADAAVQVASTLEANLIWLSPAPLAMSRRYLLKLGTRTVGARVAEVLDRFDPETGDQRYAAEIGVNDIARCRLVLERPIALDTYRRSRVLGGFILIDTASNATVAAGLVQRIDARDATPNAGEGDLYRLDAPAEATEALAAQAVQLIRADGTPAAALTAPMLADLRQAMARGGQPGLRDALVALMRGAGMTVILADADTTAPGKRLTREDIDGGLGGNWVI